MKQKFLRELNDLNDTNSITKTINIDDNIVSLIEHYKVQTKIYRREKQDLRLQIIKKKEQ